MNVEIGKTGPKISSFISFESSDGFLIIVGQMYLSFELTVFKPPIIISPPEFWIHWDTLSTAYSLISLPTKSLKPKDFGSFLLIPYCLCKWKSKESTVLSSNDSWTRM